VIPKLGKFTCGRCTREFLHPATLEKHDCGGLAAIYQTPQGPRAKEHADVTGLCYCPACARPFVSRKVVGGNNRTPAHNIIARDGLKLTGGMKDHYGEELFGDKQADAVGSYGNVLIIVFLLHFEGLMTSKSVPIYRFKKEKLWLAVKAFLEGGGRDFLYSTGNKYKFGLGDGDRWDTEFSLEGLLDRLFGSLAHAKDRRKEPKEADWKPNDSLSAKAKAIFKSIAGLAPKDSYTTYYCQTGLDAQCGTCESRQGEANLLCRYFAVKDVIGKQNSANVIWTEDAPDLLSFIGLQFCCDDKGDPCTSVDGISETWLTKVTVWQAYRHLTSILTTLKEKIFGNQFHPIARDTPIPVVLETLYYNWGAFSLFYTLAFLRVSAGDYDDNTQLYALGQMSDALQKKLHKVDDKASDETNALNLASRRFQLKEDSGASIGGVACALPVKKW
jgi:hypothetical protein